MKFYLVSDLADFASWGQFAVAIGALIVAIVTAVQTKKIKQLTDVTDELARQTKELTKQNSILEGRLNLEMSLSIYKRMPVFEPCGIVPTAIMFNYSLVVKNVGKKAFKIKLEHNPDLLYHVNVLEDSCGTEGTIRIVVDFKNKQRYEELKFNFSIIFHDNMNEYYRQRIYQVDQFGDYYMTLPDFIKRQAID